jgi:hypothetical protein
MFMNFSEFASLCYQMEKTSSRIAKVEAAAEYLKRLEADEIRFGIAFLSGRAFPLSDPRTLDIGPSAFAHIAETPELEDLVPAPLTLTDVAESFAAIAALSGKGSRAQKHARLRELVEQTASQERPILFRLLHNELRIGLHDGLIQEAIARASGTDLKTVRRSLPFRSSRSCLHRCHPGRRGSSGRRHQIVYSASPDAFRTLRRSRRGA